jgi:hypothetical protein
LSTLFFSYSHVDEGLRDQLEIHLSALKRQGLISSWHDRRITACSEFAAQIDEHLDSADVILLLVSPNFIASDYCYDLEMTRAMEKHKKGESPLCQDGRTDYDLKFYGPNRRGFQCVGIPGLNNEVI